MNKASLILCAALAVSGIATAANDPGGIIFIGDSITQGGKFVGNMETPSYRYQLFKNFVDNGVTYNPMGTTNGASGGYDVSALTPTYRGQDFINVSESAASARSYQYAGHDGKSYGYRADPGTVLPAANRGPLSVKLGLENPYTGTANTFYNGGTLTTYTGQTYEDLYGDVKAQTAVIMIGINDIYDMNTSNHQPHEVIAENVHRIVTTLQEYNENINVVVTGLLPVGSSNGAYSKLPGYNELLEKAVTGGDGNGGWSTATSTVTYADVSTGFYATNGSMVDGPTGTTGAHPNLQGNLIIAGNLARVLGVGQRTLGLERKSGAQLVSHANLTTALPTINLTNPTTGESKTATFSYYGSGPSSIVSVTDKGLNFNSELGVKDSGIKLDLDAVQDGARIATYDISLKMLHSAENADKNYFSIFIGDGIYGSGLLSVGEDGIFWGTAGSTADGAMLYGAEYSADNAHIFTADTDIRIVVSGLTEDGTKGLFQVWLGDQLIGEDLTATVVNSYKDNVLLGKCSYNHATLAELNSFSMELGTAFAPIPEPTTATLSLAALAALLLRRRRNY